MALTLTSSKEKWLWIRAVACVLAIYCSLPVVRPIANFLRDHNLLRATVAFAFAITVGLILRVVLRAQPGKRELITLGGFGLLYLLVLSTLPLPEERIHYLEYGLLAGFIYSALSQRHTHQLKISDEELASPEIWALGPIFWALILTFVCGWIDEGIQAILPDRYYEFRDVAINALAGTIAVVAIVALRHARRADQKSQKIGLESF